MASTTASLSIAELLSGPFLLNIPAYQRNYAWEREQAEQLFEDIMEEAGLNNGGDVAASPGYFLGAILLMDTPGNFTTKISAKLTPREFDVVDGQQRLITLLTLFAVLRDLEQDAKRPVGKRVAGMLIAQQGARFFRTERYRMHVSGPDRAAFEQNIMKPGSTLLPPAVTSGSAGQSHLLSVRELFKSLAGDLTEKVRQALAAYVADSCHVVVIVSHDIDRAHRAFVVLNERGKKLKTNDILKADVLSRLPTSEVNWAGQVWDQISGELGDDFESFFSHLRSVYGYTQPKIVSGVRAVIREVGGVEPFLTNVVQPLAHAYMVIRSGGEGELPAGMVRRLAYLNRLPDGDWAPAAMLALKDWRTDAGRADFLLAEIDRLAHLTRMLCAGTGKRVRRFADLISAVRAGDVRGASHPALQISREESRNIAFHLKDLHKRNPKVCKLLLLRLSDELEGTVSHVDPDQYTIEHVLPQRPAATSAWRQWYATAEERSEVVDSLGNLVLISQAQNDKARNASFEQKKEIYSAATAKIPILAITRDVLDVAEWRRAEIEAREQRLIELIEKLWRVELRMPRATPRAAE